MPNQKFEIGSKLRVITDGWCKDKIGRLEYFVPDAPKCYGLIIPNVKGTVWCKSDEVEEVKENEKEQFKEK